MFNEIMRGISAIFGETAETCFIAITVLLFSAILISILAAIINIVIDFMIDDSIVLRRVKYVIECIKEFMMIVFLLIVIIGLFDLLLLR